VRRGKRFISNAEVEHIAWLARIELSEDEKKLFLTQFNDILAYFQKINKVDTTGIEPTRHVLEIKNVFREDEARPSLSIEEVFKNAPRKERGYFKAPRII